MRDIVIIIFDALIIIFIFNLLYIIHISINKLIALGYKFLELGHALVSAIKNQSSAVRAVDELPRQRANVEVGQIPLDVIAPNLKKPPRSPGGFGSKVLDEK